ncbi:MAG: class I SAM-dependent methyltransferase [Parvibaculum sp.]|uniref:class I SAM-dependent methyltransferase n=1 Tax=Parvibaculum sp. TaxID=2024848 RepID=UPI002AB94414|nr:class I SAM-dependent methyltransferase [Parvibaculum sp.]MDZ4381588.1 class I SAM-dependent methyltransferase [Parvibaculum sp.]
MQSADIPDVQKFYDTEYQISLTSEDADQLYDVVDGVPVYRTQYQAELIIDFVDIPKGASVLDYGAAKAKSLYRLRERRPDITPHVFDVSEDYRSYWQGWVPEEQQATYLAPAEWNGRFDLITAHFVLEHVREPVEVFSDIARLLSPSGRFFFSVPDVLGNPADMIVVDHLNHFTRTSLSVALDRAGMKIERIDTSRLRGAFVVVAVLRQGEEKVAPPGRSDIDTQIQSLNRCCESWHAAEKIVANALARHAGKKIAIYGAGVYGTFVYSRVRDIGAAACFVDRNPHVHGRDHLGVQVVPPEALPTDIDVLYVALNPAIARKAMADLVLNQRKGLELVYLS